MTQESPAIVHFPHPDPLLPFSAAVRVGDVVYLSGQIGVGPDGHLPEGIDAQARLAIANMADSAALAGVTLADIFKCTIMLANIADWSAFNAIYLESFDPNRLPARSAFATDGLALGALVEIEAIAVARG